MSRQTIAMLAGVALGSLSAGCQLTADDAASEFRNGVPRKETVEVKVPTSGRAQALTLESQEQALRGEIAGLYKLTYGVTHLINGGAFFVGALVKAVLRYPPTEMGDGHATWGPWSEPLEPIAWKVTITRVGDHQYQYAFQGRPKHDAGAPFITVLAGTHTAAVDDGGDPVEGFGAGSFTLDFDARNMLPLPPRARDGKLEDVGKAHYSYARPQPGTTAEIAAQFRQVRDEETDRLVDVDYLYGQMPGGPGSMEFTFAAPASMAMAAGRWAVKSRWTQAGAGRSDVRATSADLPTPLTASECWDQSFRSLFFGALWEPASGWGTEAECVFKTAEFSSL